MPVGAAAAVPALPPGRRKVMSLLPMVLLLASADSEITIPGTAIAQQIQLSLVDLKAELHADRIGNDGKRIPGSFLQLGHRLGDRRFEFSVPDREVDLGYAGKIIYRVHDVRLQSVKVSTVQGEFIFDAAFFSKGVALKGSH